MRDIVEAISKAGGNCFEVGGCVRDSFLNVESKDIDIEVYNLDADTLTDVLSNFGKVNTVGASFGVIKLTTENDDFDFTLPRRDSKVGDGHKGFTVEVDHNMTLKEASSRRDFTINSISRNALTGELFDPFDGADHLRCGILRATSTKFSEDTGETIVWFCNGNPLDAEIGDELTIKATVKKFDEYNGWKQTVVTRVVNQEK